ncbi:MAG: helix-turn-helix transcriptional regulator [Thermoanaerobaculia bacterium]|nr:helix-turn-helix transcriptional regulator [Thermoanaerobaculia bacterium]
MGSFDRLGRALRWIRQRQGKKQFEIASDARITKAMLSSYENEKQRPTLETLERILAALRVDLDGLAYAMRAVAQEEQAKGASAGTAPRTHPAEIDPWVDGSALNLQEVLRLPRSLESPEAHAIGQMFQGFHALLRYFLIRADGAIPSEVPPRLPSEP